MTLKTLKTYQITIYIKFVGWKAWLAQLFSLIYIPFISNRIQDLRSNTWLTSVLNILEGLVCFGFVL